MPDHDQTRRQPGWRILVAATAVTLSGGAAAVAQAAEAPSAGRVTLDDVVPMTEVARPAALAIGGSADAIVLTERYDQVPSLNVVQAATDDATVQADASPTPNTPNSPDPTPNSPDPTPNTPDPSPNTPDTPDPTPDTPDMTPDSPVTPDASPESPD